MATLAARITALAEAVRDKLNLMTPRLVPAGGATGQALVKSSASNYAVAWGDFATKAYVDALIEGLAWKDSVRAASTANINLAAPGAAIDGVTMAAGDRFLVKNQTVGADNGIYVWNGSAVAATRAADASTFAEMEAAVVVIEEGTANGATAWRQSVVNGTLGTTTITWLTFGGGGASSQISVFTSSGTWTKPAGVTEVEVICIGAGSGGGSGRKGAAGTVRCGGGGGAGGGFVSSKFIASQLGATETVTVGAGGSGGASVSANSTNGNGGGDGGASQFGSWLFAAGSYGASGGTASGGGAGIGASNGRGSMLIQGNGAAADTSGGYGTNADAYHSITGNYLTIGCGGGESGGGVTSGNIGRDGGNGAGPLWANANIGTGTAGNGTSPSARANGDIRPNAGGGGGGGNNAGAGGNGGAGGFPGGGGGGGGASTDNVGSSGAGGAGGNGVVVVISRV